MPAEYYNEDLIKEILNKDSKLIEMNLTETNAILLSRKFILEDRTDHNGGYHLYYKNREKAILIRIKTHGDDLDDEFLQHITNHAHLIVSDYQDSIYDVRNEWGKRDSNGNFVSQMEQIKGMKILKSRRNQLKEKQKSEKSSEKKKFNESEIDKLISSQYGISWHHKFRSKQLSGAENLEVEWLH